MKNFDRSDVLSWISDLYKDVYGCRPRGYSFNEWTDAELETYTDELIEQLKKNEAEEEKFEKECEVAFEKEIQITIDLGAKDKWTALRWIYQATADDEDISVHQMDFDHFLWGRGIAYTEYGTKIKQTLTQIFSK